MTDLAKKLEKRWGEKYVDERDWPVYNEQLVKRGEFLLDLEWMKSWDAELKEMNKNKVGHRFLFPNSLIKLQAIFKAKNIPYRMIEGMTRQLVIIAGIPAYNDYSTICRRVNRLPLKLEKPRGHLIELFADGSGNQAINGGEYLREKYGKKNRIWIQVIILGDPITKEPVSFEINLIPASETDSAKRQVEKLLNEGIKISKFGGDGAFDDMKIWKMCESKGIQPVIKPDKNARMDSDSHLRNENVIERNKNGYKKWAKTHEYGRRWLATEGIFSATKRIFGEHLSATSEKGLTQEAGIKIWGYQRLKRYGEA